MSSLRTKIIFSTSISMIALMAMAILIYADLNYLQKQIIESGKVRDFVASVQQLQSNEENLLLYHDQDAYFQLHQQLDHTATIYTDARPFFTELVTPHLLDNLDKNLDLYEKMLDEVKELHTTEIDAMKPGLRDISESINRDVREVGLRYNQTLSDVTTIVRWTLAITMTLVVVIGIGSAFFVTRQILRPINTLEHQLDAVAQGDMRRLTLDTDDIELQSFVQHFNSMLDDLRSQQTEIRHHEKAAALGVLVSGVAHELNNPLSNISTSVQLLLEDDGTTKPELRQQWLEHVDSESERARRIVRRLLDSVRQPKLNMQTMDTTDVVQSAVILIHRQIHEIFLDIEDISKAPLRVDRERIQQVFINLIRNAVDAGAQNIWVFGEETTWADSRPEDIDRVEGKVGAISHLEKMFLFTIADDGPGIPEANLSQLFTPFFTTKTGGEGTGLGLYLVEEIVDEHDGCITAESRTDGGTQFLIWLPIADEETKS